MKRGPLRQERNHSRVKKKLLGGLRKNMKGATYYTWLLTETNRDQSHVLT